MMKRLGRDYDSSKYVSFTITNSLHSPNDIRPSWPIIFDSIVKFGMKVGRFGLGFKSVLHMTGETTMKSRRCKYLLNT
jgi:hypothetical protein